MSFLAGVDPARAWQLQVYVNDDRVLDKLIETASDNRDWQQIEIDLSKYRNQEVALRLCQPVLIPHPEAGNVYWRNLILK